MADYLPQELFIEILLRLSVKILVQCTCVCKSWNAIITNPSFITSHLNRTILSDNKNNTTYLLFLENQFMNGKKEKYVLRPDNESINEYTELEFPIFQSQNPYFTIAGSCNGLLCLSYDGGVHTILYNPSIRKSVTLPIPRVMPTLIDPPMFVLGFGYDSKSNDYKVVRLAYTQCTRNNYLLPPEVELYSLRTGSWRGISASAPLYNVIDGKWPQFMNGAVHWLACDLNCNWILSFDMGNEVFCTMELPKSLHGQFVAKMSVKVFGELLSLFHGHWNGTWRCSIWVLKEYGVAESWTKHFTIDLQFGLDMVLGLRKNGEILVGRNGIVVSYHPETRQVQDLTIHGTALSLFYVNTYMESLVLLNEVNGVLRRKSYISIKF